MAELRPFDIKKPGISFVTAEPFSAQKGLCIVSIDELFEKRESHSFLVVLDGDVAQAILVPINCVDVVVVDNDGEMNGYFIGENGEHWHYNGSTIEEDLPIDSDNLAAPRDMHQHNNRLYVVGGGNHLFHRDLPGAWKALPVLEESLTSEFNYLGFESVTTSSTGTVFSCGWHGLAWKMEGASPELIELPTNVDLNIAAVDSSGRVFFGGNEGVLIVGDGSDSWKLVENELTEEPIWGIAEFDDRVFILIVNFLYELIDGVVSQVDYSGECLPPSFGHRLNPCDECLWCIGAKQISKFSNGRWEQVCMLG